MADLVKSLFVAKEEQKFKGDLANDKVLEKGKHGLGKAQYKLIMDSPLTGVEGTYFWVIRQMEERPPFGLNYAGEGGRIEKIKDIYTAGETSSYWGMAEQRKGVQQEKFQQLMANIGQLLKTLFQLIRELRIIDERLQYYEEEKEGKKPAQVALKSIWVDMVEGGSKNPASVLGLGSQVGFVTLPDLFFETDVHAAKDAKDVEREVDKLQSFNRKIREVLGRKLAQYIYWREKTYEELIKGQQFKLKYMRQHYHVIRLYLNWLRPYLKNVQRLEMQRIDKYGMQGTNQYDIIAAFETSKIELEVLGIKTKYEAEGEYGKETKEFKEFFPVVRVQFSYVAMPEIAFQAEGQRGAIHRGRTVIIIDAFVATKEDLEEYKKKIEGEDLELLTAVDESILALKDDLEKYLLKAEQVKKKEEEKQGEKGESVFAPFKHMFLGFRDLAGIPTKERKTKGKHRGEKSQAEEIAKTDAYLIYNIYKKTHGMFTEE
ncbi:hypothetical protein HYS50_03280 [Candidatus Woesearchaeota archaeon]|nr:hypothetical protein [Candidatus Woesearchaeota archaeon]